MDRLSTYQPFTDGPCRGQVEFDDQSTDETRFDVYIQGGAYANWTSVASLPGDTAMGIRNPLIPGNLDPQTTYCFKVDAYNSWDHSEAQGCFTTPRLPPLTPWLDTVTTAGTTSLNVKFEDRSTDEDAFHVHYIPDGATTYDEQTVPAHPGTGPVTITLSGLSPGTRYCAWVSSAYQNLESHWGTPGGCASTVTPPPPPLAPTGFTITLVTQTSISLQ